MFTWADGQLAAATGVLYTGGSIPAGMSGVTAPGGLGGFYAVSLSGVTSSTETIVLYVKRVFAGGTTNRQIGHCVLAQNETALITGIILSPGDTLSASASDATAVDYIVSDSPPGPLEINVYDANGSLKQTNGTTISGATTITSTSANALDVGRQGATSPVLQVDASASTVVTGVKLTGAASGSGVAVAAIGGNNNEKLTIDAVGTGIIYLGSISTGGANVRVPVQTVAAAGTAIGNAQAVVEGYTYVTGSNNANAVKLPAGAIGMQITLVNTVQSATLQVFPQVNNAINNLANNAVYNIPNGSKRTFTYATAGQWYSDAQTIL